MSSPAEAIHRPSGLYATARTSSVCPVRVKSSRAGGSVIGEASQIRIVPSSLAVASRWPSGLNATAIAVSVCPCRVRASWPVLGSQILTL